jgi:Tol biopolymer transport system component/DNA-binding winged helix-turn-helix (wHTH) protein
MLPQSQLPRVVRFGTFEVDVPAGELRKNGLKLKLQEQPFQVLCMLLEHPGEVVTREELRSRLWPADTFVDFDHGLNAAVKRLRDTLGDSAENPRFIETVARRGYRFVGMVDIPSATPSTQATQAPPRNTKWNKRNWILVAIAVACLVFAITLSRFLSKLPAAQINMSPLVTYPGEKYFPSLSPSGQQVVFSWNGGAGTHFSLYEKIVGSERFLRLTSVPDVFDFGAVWSHDGREIAFARIVDGNAGIYTISALGGPERKLLRTGWASTGTIDAFTPRFLDWSPDSRSIIYSDSPAAGQPQALFQLSLDSMRTRQLTSPLFQTGDVDPEVSPDGQTIAFVRDTIGGQSIYVTPISGGRQRLIASGLGLTVGLAWTGDGRSLIFGGRWLWTVPVAGGSPVRLQFGQDAYQPSIRGNRIAYTQASWSDSIWRRQVDSKGRYGQAQPLISSTRIDAGPQFSPDGDTIAFQSDRSGAFEIWLCKSDASDIRQLTHLGVAWTGTPRWSPDGKFVVFDSRPNGNADLFLADVQGGPPRRLTSDPSNEVVPSWSGDGRWIYFASDRSGRWEVWKIPSAGGNAIQITHHGGFAALESVDGKTLYYAKGLAVRGIWQIATGGGEESEVLGMPQPGFWGYWGPARHGIFYLDTSGAPGINFLNLSTHTADRVFALENRPAEHAPGLAISRDGKFILYTQVNQSGTNIDLVQDFK